MSEFLIKINISISLPRETYSCFTEAIIPLFLPRETYFYFTGAKCEAAATSLNNSF